MSKTHTVLHGSYVLDYIHTYAHTHTHTVCEHNNTSATIVWVVYIVFLLCECMCDVSRDSNT